MTKMESVLSKSKLDIKVDWNAIILIIIRFLLARVSILDKLYPFGISLLGSYLIFKKENKAALFTSLAGTLTALRFGGISYYISSLLIILQIAKSSSGNEIKDDMTVMVTKVWRNNN